eukprot:scaffold11537_cov115-Amphora_coffeaeformis.AAC.1
MLWVDEPAEGRGAQSFGGFVGVEEVKGTKKGVGWVVEGYGVGPGDVFAGVWDCGGFELHTLQVFDDAIGCGAVSVPDGPPAAGLFREVLVGGWLAEEVAVVGSRCRGLVVEVDLDSGKPGSECSLEPVGDEEEFVGGGEDGFVEGRWWRRCVGYGRGQQEGRSQCGGGLVAMNAAASVVESRAMTSVMMEKPVRLHMAERKYWEPSYAGMAGVVACGVE